MEVRMNVTTSDSCKVIILDLTKYLEESSEATLANDFKRSLTVTIDVLELNKTSGSEYKEAIYTVYGKSNSIEVPVGFDGWFTVNHIIIPSKEWFDSEKKRTDGSALNNYTVVYYSDGKSIRKYINGKEGIATIEELVERNTKGTTISRIQSEYVSICFLRKCYINLCQQIFNNRGFSSCWNKNNVDSELVFKRDLAWMAINVIKYLTECNQLYEVERIIESLLGCNGLCNSSNITSTTNGCGCSK